MPSVFVPEKINAIDGNYQQQYKAKLRLAIEGYLAWMQLHVSSRWRFSHFHHGNAGKIRVKHLQNTLIDPGCDFNSLVEKVAKVMRASGYCQHSFNRFLYQHMTGEKVIDVKPPVTTVEFYNRRRLHWDRELATDQPQALLEIYSFMSLTKGVSKIYEDERARLDNESRGHNSQAGNQAYLMMQPSHGSSCDHHHHHHHN